MKNIADHINLLGCSVQDKITKLKGTVTSICFDLYGCIQAAVHPGLDEKGEPRENRWYDVSRLIVTSPKKSMPTPDFGNVSISEGAKGPAEKQSFGKP